VARTLLHGRTFARVAPMRAKVFFYLCLAVAGFLGVRLYLVQIVQGPSLARQAFAQRSDTVEVFARRGFIADRNGNLLVRSLPSESVYAVPHDLTDPDATVAKLQSVFGKLDPNTIAALHDRSLWFIWIARKVPVEVAERIRKLNLPGVQLKEEVTGKRIDMVGDMASTLLGFVGTDENGLDGLEYEFDSLLKGQSGEVTLEADDFGRPIPFGHETVVKAAQPGMGLELTIDSYLQFATEEALDQAVEKYHAEDGTAIVMDPWTGEILAMANMPHFDPNHFWRYPANDYRDRAVADVYEPGSTYKLITAMAIPDHSTIAEFRRRHEKALGELFTAVLSLCCEAGLVEVGVISVDGVKIRANASRGANRTYEKLVADILKEAEETDRWEDGLFGEDRGDEPPEHLRTAEGRRAAFQAAKERLAQKAGRGEEPEVARIELDPDRVAAGMGRRGWQRAAHKELMQRREQDAKPIARSRAERLLETLYRLEENRQVEIGANDAYEKWWAERRAGGVPGQKLGMPPKPVTPR